jgi:hypothetical protein
MKKVVFTKKNDIMIDGEWSGNIVKSLTGWYVADVLYGGYLIPVKSDTREGLRELVQWAIKESTARI